MAGPVMKQRGPVEVEFFGFCLQERDAAAVPVQFSEGWDTEGGFLTAREGGLDVKSAGHTPFGLASGGLRLLRISRWRCGTNRRRIRVAGHQAANYVV